MRQRNGQPSATPFVRLASLTMHRLSFHDDADIAADVKTKIGGFTPEQFKAHWPEAFDKIGATAVDQFKTTLPKAPDKYEVKLPDGAVLTSEVLERVTPTMRAVGITSNEGAQKLVDAINSEAKLLRDRIAADFSPGGTVFESQRNQYNAAALAAPDLGNGSAEILQAKVARTTNFTNKYFPDDVRKLINDTGIGSHPGFFRAVLKLADLMKEDGYMGGPSTKPPKTHAERIYGKEAVTK